MESDAVVKLSFHSGLHILYGVTILYVQYIQYDELGTGQSGHNLFGHQPYQFQITK